MKKHTQIYFKAFGFDVSDWIPCEVCNATAVDIHHIESRGMGGSKTADEPSNLMALCRKCHEHFGDKKEHEDYLRECHSKLNNKEDAATYAK